MNTPSHKTPTWSVAHTVLVLLAIFVLQGSMAVTLNAATPEPASDTTGLPSKYTLLEPLPCIKTEGLNCAPGTQIKEVNFKEYTLYAFNLLIALAAVSAVFMIVWGGFQYMTTDSWQGKSEGISKAKNAILGLVLVLCSFLILKTIDPRLVEISDTLVPPLKLDYNKKAIGELFDSLEKQGNSLSQYDKNRAAGKTQRDQIRHDAEALSNEQAVLSDQWKSYDAEIKKREQFGEDADLPNLIQKRTQIEKELADVNNKYNKLGSSYVSSLAVDNIEGQRVQALAGTTDTSIFGSNTTVYNVEDLKSNEAVIDKKFETAMTQLEKFGNPVDQAEENKIRNSYYYSKAIIQAKEISEGYYDKFSTDQLAKDTAAARQIVSQIPDPQLRQEAATAIDTAHAKGAARLKNRGGNIGGS